MSMFGIDISSYQQGLGIKATGAQFAIMKATDGTRFVDKTCDGFVQQCKRDGILWGFYHFANGTHKSSMKAQAQYFVNACKGYFGEGVPFLDWEDSSEKYGGAVIKYGPAAAKEWLDEVYRLTGVRPIIYMSKSVARAYDWSQVAKDYGLWCAQYANNAHVGFKSDPWTDSNGYGAFGGCAIYQYTGTGRLPEWGGDLDLDIAYMDSAAWGKYANPSGNATQPQPASQQPAAPSGSTIDLAVATLNGDYGNGDERRNRLGSRYDEVQALINRAATASVSDLASDVFAGKFGNGETRKRILGGRYESVQAVVNNGGRKSVDAIAREVIAGKWGNNPQRKQRLQAAGYDYAAVQKRVNQLL